MQTLLKLCIVAVMLVLSVSSCIKENDSIIVDIYQPYFLQTEDDKFIPQMRLQSPELKSASLSVDGKKNSFKSITSPSYTWELPNSSLYALDTVSSTNATVTLLGVDGKIETHQVWISSTTKKIGEINVDSLKYNPIDNSIYIQLSSEVDNAIVYYLMYKSPIGTEASTSYAMWMPYNNRVLDIDEGKLFTTVSVNTLTGVYKDDVTYQFAVGAGYGTTVKIDDKIEYVTIKK